MSMEIFNIEGALKLFVEPSVKTVKEIIEDYNDSICYDYKYDKMTNLNLNELIKLDYSLEEGFIISLIPNSHVTYKNNCIPNMDKEFVFENIAGLLQDILIHRLNEVKEINNISGNIIFETDEDDYPEYEIKVIGDNNKLGLFKIKDKEDYKKDLEDLFDKITKEEPFHTPSLREEMLQETILIDEINILQ